MSAIREMKAADFGFARESDVLRRIEMAATVARMTKHDMKGCSKRQPTRPQGRKNRRRTLWGTLRILSSRERSWGPFSAA
jgi:hypothetical protein